ncbi:MAG: hypothetical protein PHY43_10755 [Verrucomicrobiales bacterium]|nr:hypothetical protein [Verrucomicrobiales bacterium]
MKPYILRQPQPVQPQKSIRPPRLKPAAGVAAAHLRPRPGAPTKGPALFIGLDVHNDSIAVSLAPSGSAEVRRYGIIGGEHDDVLKLAHKLQAAHPGTTLKFCYEAGPRGFALGRWPVNWRGLCGPSRARSNPWRRSSEAKAKSGRLLIKKPKEKK